MRRLFLLLLLLGALAACSNQDTPDGELPTRVVVATIGADESTETTAPLTAESRPTTAAESPEGLTAESSEAATPTLDPKTTEITVTPSMTITDTPTRTATNTLPPSMTPSETPEDQALLGIVQLALSVTVPPEYIYGTRPPTIVPAGVLLPTSALPTPTTPGSNCQYAPAGMFAALIASNPTLSNLVGCAVGAPPTTRTQSAAVQSFQNGLMIWINDQPGTIYVLFNGGTLQRYQDTFDSATDPESGRETPPDGLREPIRGFGKVWRENPGVRDGLAWATTGESPDTATIQEFTNGRMIYLPTRGLVYVLAPGSGSWQSISS